MCSLENTRATLQYQLNDKVAMVMTASVNSAGEGDGGIVEAKAVATNRAALGLDKLPSKPKRHAENSDRRGSSGNTVCPVLGAERLNSFSPR